MTIDRKISQDEVEQFYEDFSSEFVAPEERDVSFIVLSTDDIAAKINLSDEDIEAYYNENLNQFETPETRNVLQMVFDSQEEADKANAALKEGKDFMPWRKSWPNKTERLPIWALFRRIC